MGFTSAVYLDLSIFLLLFITFSSHSLFVQIGYKA